LSALRTQLGHRAMSEMCQKPTSANLVLANFLG